MTSLRPRGAGSPDGTEVGFAAIELVAGLALLLLPVAIVVLTLPTWAERQTTGRAIAREVARRTAASGVCDVAAARELAGSMARNLGVPPGDAHAAIGCEPGAVLDPGSTLEADVTVRMPAVHLLGIGDLGAWTWTARHREPVDVYVGAP
ncbi:MAG TPA: hypothetical protein VFZ17_07080 [Acidimicrobiia bacterium]|nr:hypothetical protein [Acidimicrobiia bacterium]